jgi:hypothetical protein
MWLGPVLFIRSFVGIVFFILIYWLYYERIMFAEEQFLRRKFVDTYDKWSEKVKAVIPGFKGYVKPSLPFSAKTVLKREHNSLFGVFVIFVALDLFRNYFLSERIFLTPMWIWTGVPALAIWALLRLIHKKTGWLITEGR